MKTVLLLFFGVHLHGKSHNFLIVAVADTVGSVPFVEQVARTTNFPQQRRRFEPAGEFRLAALFPIPNFLLSLATATTSSSVASSLALSTDTYGANFPNLSLAF